MEKVWIFENEEGLNYIFQKPKWTYVGTFMDSSINIFFFNYLQISLLPPIKLFSVNNKDFKED